MTLKEQLDSIIYQWFYRKQAELDIGSGDTPLDCMIDELIDKLIDECHRVLEWQQKQCEHTEPLFVFQNKYKIVEPDLSISGVPLTLSESLDLYCDGEDVFDKNSGDYYIRADLIIKYFRDKEVRNGRTVH